MQRPAARPPRACGLAMLSGITPWHRADGPLPEEVRRGYVALAAVLDPPGAVLDRAGGEGGPGRKSGEGA